MGVKLRIKSNKIYLSICQNRKQWLESTGLTVSTDKAQQKEVLKMAEVIRSKREIALAAVTNGIQDRERSKMLLSDYMKELASLKQGQNEKIFLRCVPYIIEYSDVPIKALTYTYYEGFKSFLQKHEKLQSSYTQAKYLSLLKQVAKKALREKLIIEDPTEGVTGITVHESKRQFLTKEEIKQMADCNYRSSEYMDEIRPAFFFSILTGLRISDVRMLRWGHIEGNNIIKKQRKTSDFVYIPIQPIALEILGYNETLPKDALIFPLLASMEDVSYTNRQLKAWAKKAGIHKNVTWHVARHTYATQLFIAGADLFTIQKLLGHTKIETTQKYTKVIDEKKIEAVQNLPDFGIR